MDDLRTQPPPEPAETLEPVPTVRERAATGDDAPAVSEVEARELSAADQDSERPYRIAAWLVIVGSLALAALLVSLPAHVYEFSFSGRLIARTPRVDVFELWRVQANNLPDIGLAGLTEVLFTICALVFVFGSAYLIWIAMVDIKPTPTVSSPSAGVPDESEPA